MAENVEVKERKKASWSYSLTAHILEVNFPDNYTGKFDISSIVKGCTVTQELAIYYGLKQWVASNTADPKVYPTSKDKWNKMREDLEGARDHGLQQAGEGKIGVTGRVRANAGVASEDKKLAGEVKSVRQNLTVDAALGLFLVGMTLKPEEEVLLKTPEAQKKLKALGRTFPVVEGK